jgi:hypothetical protein
VLSWLAGWVLLALLYAAAPYGSAPADAGMLECACAITPSGTVHAAVMSTLCTDPASQSSCKQQAHAPTVWGLSTYAVYGPSQVFTQPV